MLSLVQEMTTVSPEAESHAWLRKGEVRRAAGHRWCSSRERCAGTQRTACTSGGGEHEFRVGGVRMWFEKGG